MKKQGLSWLLISVAALILVSIILRMRYGNKIFYKNVFVDPGQHISFAYPEERMVMTGATNPYLIATVLSPDISEYTPSFNVTKEEIPADMSLDVYVRQTMNQLREVIGQFKQQEAANLNVDGHPARRILFSGLYLNQAFSWEQIYTIKDNMIYVMTYLAPTDNFSGHRDDIQTSFSTFAFK